VCGIVGYINFDAVNINDREKVSHVLERMSYRGPDDQGTWESDQVILGHRRLSIIDLSSNAKQPFHFHEKEISFVFNGEIYNYQYLANFLRGQGYRFRTNSDTEVIGYAYDYWGEDFVQQLNGMFAIVLYDARRKKIFCYRDRLGEKPLFIMEENKKIFICSELQYFSIFTKLNINIEALNDYFINQFISSPQTIYSHVESITPGTYLVINLNNFVREKKTYWNITEFPEREDKCTDENISLSEIRETLYNSVSSRLVSDVPVGILLSGGIDSTIIALIAKRIYNNNLKSFHVSFPD